MTDVMPPRFSAPVSRDPLDRSLRAHAVQQIHNDERIGLLLLAGPGARIGRL